MKIGLNTDGFAQLPLEKCLDRCAELGLEFVEFALGGWSGAPHVSIDKMLSSSAARDGLLGLVRERQLAISALNCSGNPLHPKEEVGPKDAELARKTVDLAKLLGVSRVVMMSGLPSAP